MMELNLDEKFKITTDKYNYILQEYQRVTPRKNEDGTRPEVKYEWKDIGYFGRSLTGALKKYLNEYIREQSTISIEELIKVIKLAEERIEKAVRENREKLRNVLLQ